MAVVKPQVNKMNIILAATAFLLLVGFGIYILARGQKALHKQLDGRLTELLTVTKALAHSQGVAIGRAEIIDEQQKTANPGN
jgi:hypothetical protein